MFLEGNKNKDLIYGPKYLSQKSSLRRGPNSGFTFLSPSGSDYVRKATDGHTQMDDAP